MQQDVTRCSTIPILHNGRAKIIPDGAPVDCVGADAAKLTPGEYTGTLANPNGRHDTVRRITQFRPADLHPHVQACPLGNGARRSVLPSLASETISAIRAMRDASSRSPPAIPSRRCSRRHAVHPAGQPRRSGWRGRWDTTTTGFGGSAGIIEIFFSSWCAKGTTTSLSPSSNSAGPVRKHRHRFPRSDFCSIQRPGQ